MMVCVIGTFSNGRHKQQARSGACRWIVMLFVSPCAQ
jgi:hypothetical protein